MKTTVSTRGQVSIPAALRKKYGIETETQVEWIEEGNAIKIVLLPKDPIKAFRGAGRNRYTSDRLIMDREKERLEEDGSDRNS
jgi:AbrB family looped-hinge helix DNA binding protein